IESVSEEDPYHARRRSVVIDVIYEKERENFDPRIFHAILLTKMLLNRVLDLSGKQRLLVDTETFPLPQLEIIGETNKSDTRTNLINFVPIVVRSVRQGS